MYPLNSATNATTTNTSASPADSSASSSTRRLDEHLQQKHQQEQHLRNKHINDTIKTVQNNLQNFQLSQQQQKQQSIQTNHQMQHLQQQQQQQHHHHNHHHHNQHQQGGYQQHHKNGAIKKKQFQSANRRKINAQNRNNQQKNQLLVTEVGETKRNNQQPLEIGILEQTNVISSSSTSFSCSPINNQNSTTITSITNEQIKKPIDTQLPQLKIPSPPTPSPSSPSTSQTQQTNIPLSPTYTLDFLHLVGFQMTAAVANHTVVTTSPKSNITKSPIKLTQSPFQNDASAINTNKIQSNSKPVNDESVPTDNGGHYSGTNNLIEENNIEIQNIADKIPQNSNIPKKHQNFFNGNNQRYQYPRALSLPAIQQQQQPPHQQRPFQNHYHLPNHFHHQQQYSHQQQQHHHQQQQPHHRSPQQQQQRTANILAISQVLHGISPNLTAAANLNYYNSIKQLPHPHPNPQPTPQHHHSQQNIYQNVMHQHIQQQQHRHQPSLSPTQQQQQQQQIPLQSQQNFPHLETSHFQNSNGSRPQNNNKTRWSHQKYKNNKHQSLTSSRSSSVSSSTSSSANTSISTIEKLKIESTPQKNPIELNTELKESLTNSSTKQANEMKINTNPNSLQSDQIKPISPSQKLSLPSPPKLTETNENNLTRSIEIDKKIFPTIKDVKSTDSVTITKDTNIFAKTVPDISPTTVNNMKVLPTPLTTVSKITKSPKRSIKSTKPTSVPNTPTSVGKTTNQITTIKLNSTETDIKKVDNNVSVFYAIPPLSLQPPLLQQQPLFNCPASISTVSTSPNLSSSSLFQQQQQQQQLQYSDIDHSNSELEELDIFLRSTSKLQPQQQPMYYNNGGASAAGGNNIPDNGSGDGVGIFGIQQQNIIPTSMWNPGNTATTGGGSGGGGHAHPLNNIFGNAYCGNNNVNVAGVHGGGLAGADYRMPYFDGLGSGSEKKSYSGRSSPQSISSIRSNASSTGGGGGCSSGIGCIGVDVIVGDIISLQKNHHTPNHNIHRLSPTNVPNNNRYNQHHHPQQYQQQHQQQHHQQQQQQQHQHHQQQQQQQQQLHQNHFHHLQHGNIFAPPPDRFLSRSHLVEIKLPPTNLLTDTKWDCLSELMWNKFCSAQQSEETYKKKMYLWRYLYLCVRKKNPRFSLYLVGSTMSGFGSNTSDVDMCLVLRTIPINFDPRIEAISQLTQLQNHLSKTTGIFDTFNLIGAKVPILRFKDTLHKLEVDLNYNNCVGIRNTHLLYCYSQMDWRLRPLALVVKLWAQFHNINNAKDMTISSYSLVLMTIHFLQCGINPPVLPCLHEMYPQKFKKIHDINSIDMNEDLEPYYSTNQQTLGELFLQFLEYYCNFDYTQNAISVRTASILKIDECRLARSPKNDPYQWKQLCIEEPFDLTNTARSVYDYIIFERIKNVFYLSWQKLHETLDLNSIFTVPYLEAYSSSSSPTPPAQLTPPPPPLLTSSSSSAAPPPPSYGSSSSLSSSSSFLSCSSSSSSSSSSTSTAQYNNLLSNYSPNLAALNKLTTESGTVGNSSKIIV